MKKRILILLISVLLLLTYLSIPIGALTLTYSPTNAYKNSIFYERLKSISLTGDQRRDIVNVAISQLGYHEGNSSAEFGGLNYAGTGNYVEYNHANRETLDGGGSYYWCASFVTFCARQAGISTATIINSVSCDNFVLSFKKASRYKTRASGYKPLAGDLIFFLSPEANRTYASHVGIVVGVKDGTVYTIEGNTTRDMVNYRSYPLTNTSIVGYGVPAYTGASGNYSDFDLKTGYAEPGIYRVNTDELNLRSSPKSSSKLIASIDRYTELYISEADGDWGKTVYNGKTAWASLKYLLPSDISDYRVTYKINGNDAQLDIARAGEKITLKGIGTVPIGYEFIGWSSNNGSNNADFLPGDIITVKKDLTLYAVLKAKPITIRFFDGNGELISSNVYKYGDSVKEPDHPQKASDGEFEYYFDGWDKPMIKTARADRDYYVIYSKIEITTEQSTTFTEIIESVFEVFSAEETKPLPNPETEQGSTPSESTGSSISPTQIADITSLIIFIISTVFIFIVKRKQ